MIPRCPVAEHTLSSLAQTLCFKAWAPRQHCAKGAGQFHLNAGGSPAHGLSHLAIAQARGHPGKPAWLSILLPSCTTELHTQPQGMQGGLRPHAFCLPVLKRETHRQAVLAAATSGSPKFFLGTDSAPHPKHAKVCTAQHIRTRPLDKLAVWLRLASLGAEPAETLPVAAGELGLVSMPRLGEGAEERKAHGGEAWPLQLLFLLAVAHSCWVLRDLRLCSVRRWSMR